MKENQVILYAQIKEEPLAWYKDSSEDEKELQQVLAKCIVMRSSRNVGDKSSPMKRDLIYVMTNNPETMKEIVQFKTGDIVRIKGSLSIRDITKISPPCPMCGGKYKTPGTICYVSPISAIKEKSELSREEGNKELDKNSEFSNLITVIGTVITEPKTTTLKGRNVFMTEYQIAVSRKFRIREDNPKIVRDFPWVKSYGANATEDKLRLKVGTSVMIDGCLQGRAVQKHTKCEQCGRTFDWTDYALEIVPYETEYLADFMSDEDIETQAAARLKSAKELLSE